MKAPFTIIHLINGQCIQSPINGDFTDLQIEDWKKNIGSALANPNGTVHVDDPIVAVVPSRHITYIELVLTDPPVVERRNPSRTGI